MQIFDTHCHYNLEPLAENWQNHWDTAKKAGVVGSIVVGADLPSSRRAVEIAASVPTLGAAVGYHPDEWVQPAVTLPKQETSSLISSAVDDLTKLWDIAAAAPSSPPAIVAIGETGLDYFRLAEYSSDDQIAVHQLQQAALRAHIELATKKSLPLILHVRDRCEQAYWDVLDILKTANYTGQFILHCVSGPLDYVRQALDMGGYVSVAANVTYKNAEQIRQIVKTVPADRLLTETDAPFLPPVPYRGQMCEPWMIQKAVEFLHTELGVDPEQCLTNARTLFPHQFV